MPRGRKKGSKNKVKTVMAASPSNSTNSVVKSNLFVVQNDSNNSNNNAVNANSNEPATMTIAEAIRRKKNDTSNAACNAADDAANSSDLKSAISKAVNNVAKNTAKNIVNTDTDGDDESDVDKAMGSDALNDLGYPQRSITANNRGKTAQRPITRCDRCGGPVLTAQPYTIDTATLTALAEWHRDIMPKKVNLCVMCAHELSETVERWYLKNPNAKKKAYLDK